MQFNPIGFMFDLSTYMWSNLGSILHVKKTRNMEQTKTDPVGGRATPDESNIPTRMNPRVTNPITCLKPQSTVDGNPANHLVYTNLV